MHLLPKQFQSFIIGCLASLMVFGYPARLLASTSEPQEIQGVTSDHQEAPATPSEFDDVITGMNAGVDAAALIQPSPDPIREHTAFLSSMWDVLFDSDYIAGTSYLSTGEWITGPTGTVTATNETGNTLTVDIALSLEILPDQYSFVDQASLDTLASVSARIGIAWTTMTNVDQVQSNILLYWIQRDTPQGTVTTILPMTTISQDEIDIFAAILPLMDGYFDNPLYYNIENYNPEIYGAWSKFRDAVQRAAIHFTAVVSGGTVAAVVGVAAVPESGPLGVAGAALAGATTAASIEYTGSVFIATEDLLDDLGAGPAIHQAEIRTIIDMINQYSQNGHF